MADSPTQVVTPEAQAADGQQLEQEQPKAARTPEELQVELAKKNNEAKNLRDRLHAAESKLTAAEKAQSDAEAAALAEQGRYKELFEKAQAEAQEATAKLAQMERDQQRREAAQAAGIPQLWQRLQGETAEELAADAQALAAMMQAAQPAQGGRVAQTLPTPAAQGRNGLTDEERRARSVRTW